MLPKPEKNNSKTEDIELPLLSEQKSRKKSSISKGKSNFVEFLDPRVSSQKYRKRLPFLSFVTFYDIWGLVRNINNKKEDVQPEDLPLPFEFCNVEEKIIALDAEWMKEISKKEPSIILAVLRAFKKEVGIISVLCFGLISIKLGSLPLMGDIIKSITEGNLGATKSLESMLISASLLSVCIIIGDVINAAYWHYTCVVASMVRNTMMGFTYKKLHSVTLSSIQQVNIGKVINLLSNDVNELDKGLLHLMPMIFCPFTILLSGMLMWKFFGFATIFGILGLGGFLLLSNHLSKKTQSVKQERSAITDSRIKLTNELIECVRLIKMYAWEKAFKQAIVTLREKESAKFLRLKLVSVLGESLAFTSSQSSLVIMCVIYTLAGGMLTPEKIFTSLIMLNFVSIWGVGFFHQGIMFVATIRVMKGRFESVLFIEDIKNIPQATGGHGKNMIFKSIESTPLQQQHATVEFKNYSAFWKKDESKACLSGINATLRPGQLTTVIGTIGSGKTSFLLSLLREVPFSQGELNIEGRVAYVEQDPIIFSGTVRSNILFGLEYNPTLYKTVVRACNLLPDFEQLDKKDETLVGEKGITLSGGQKARISLARALYSQSDIYLLDDPLSAVDSKVGRHIFNYAIRGQMLKDKIVVLVTHHLNYAKESDRVLLFSEGKIIGDGTFDELRVMENSLFSKFKEIEDEEEKRKSTYKYSTAVKHSGSENEKEEKCKKECEKLCKEQKTSQVTFKTYVNYVKENGNYKFFGFVLLIYLSYGVMSIGFSRFLGYWGQSHSTYEFNHQEGQEGFNNLPFVFATIFLACLTVFGDSVKFVSASKFILDTNTNMHNKALKGIAKSRILFFDQTPIGAVLNRFSNDLGTLDTGNAQLMPWVIDGFIYVLLRMITLIIINPYLFVPIVIVVVLALKIKYFLEKAVMETKRIDLSSRSPLYSEVSATINGLLAIRVFRQSGNFIQRFCEMLHTNLRAYLYMDRTLKFFTIMMSATLDILTIFGTFVCILVAYFTNLDAGLFGLTLLMIQEIAGFGNWLIRISLLVDINMQSVDRIKNFYELKPEPPKRMIQDKTLGKEWPEKGEISFSNIYMKYRPELDYVLRGLTLTIEKGSKVGIVGRTGAGKSSIIQALFRLTQTESIPGSCVKIDGVDTSSIGLNLLRNSLSIIPQTPVVFTGTIRRNLDPFGELQESDLWYALQEVNLKDHVNALEMKLDTDMTMSSSVFSAGQKQLICLARAILRKSKILLLDEATANVDIETDDFIQRKIMERFKDCTVITIAHRLITIANYDKVLVMDKGAAVEYDSPYMLMVKSKGDDFISGNGIFAGMVRNSGENMAKKIFDISRNNFFIKK